MQAMLPPMRICGACGTRTARRSDRCAACGTSNLSAREVRPDPRLAWVRVSASFVCRSCGQNSPLDAFDGDGTVSCAACGLTQAFYVPVWDDAFALAHGLADLGFPQPDGRHVERGRIPAGSSPFADVGETTVGTRFETAGLEEIDGVQRTASLRADLALGLPLCETCHEPLSVQQRGEETTSQCGRCGSTARYRAPTSSVRLPHMPDAMLVDDLRLDGAVVRTETGSGGAIAIKCPSCNAGLEVAPGQGLVVCGYCRTSCRIPSGTLHALRPGAVPPRPFWVAFVGPSLMRTRLLEEVEAAQRAREASRSIEAFVVPELRRDQALAKMGVATIVLLLVGLLFVPTILERIEAVGGKPGPISSALTPVSVAVAQTTTVTVTEVEVRGEEVATTSAEAARSEWTALPGCGCTELGAGTELGYRVRANPDATELDVEYAWLGADGFPSPLAATASTAPTTPLVARDLELAVACTQATVVYASHRAITVYDRRSGAVLAGGALREPTDDSERVEGPVTARCARAAVQGGRLRWSDEDGVPHDVEIPDADR